MGVFSNAIHLKTTDRDAVVRCYTTLLKRRGYRPRAAGAIPQYNETRDEAVFRRVLVSAVEEGWVTVVDQKHDEQGARSMNFMCHALTRTLDCAGFCFIVHDSDVFYYYLWRAGEMLDQYCSWPGWYSDAGPRRRTRTRWKPQPSLILPLCVPGVTLAELKHILRDYSKDAVDPVTPPVWAEQILQDLADCLGITDPVRTYADFHACRKALYLLVPGAAEPARLRIDREEEPAGAAWDDFVHLEFFRRT